MICLFIAQQKDKRMTDKPITEKEEKQPVILILLYRDCIKLYYNS